MHLPALGKWAGRPCRLCSALLCIISARWKVTNNLMRFSSVVSIYLVTRLGLGMRLWYLLLTTYAP